MTVSAAPLPAAGVAEELIDTVTFEVRDIWQLWPEAPEYQVTLTFPHEHAIESLNLIGDSINAPVFKVFTPLPEQIRVEVSNDGFKQDVRSCKVEATSGEACFKHFYGTLDRMETRRAVINQAARQVRITLPAPESGRPLTFQEIEVYGSRQVRPAITQLVSADLYGNGKPQTLMVDETNSLIVLDQEGSERWRYRFAANVNILSCHDLYNDGSQYICAGLLGGDLVILTPEGKVWKHLKLADQFSSRQDVFKGLLKTPYSICIWQRDAHGQAALAVGGYSTIVFLNPEGEIIGHSWVDGPWTFNILAAPAGEPEAGDLWSRCGWSHGITRYEGKPGFEPSGAEMNFGGIHQPMFRALRKIIPFVNGRSAAFEWYTGDPALGRVIVAAAEDGVGVLSTRSQDFVWKVEGGTTITACRIAASQPGLVEVVIGGVDGFVAAFNLADGSPLHKWWAGAPVVGLASFSPGSQLWAVVTQQGVWAMDAAWRPQAFYPLEAARMCQAGEQGVVVACQDGSLVKLKINSIS